MKQTENPVILSTHGKTQTILPQQLVKAKEKKKQQNNIKTKEQSKVNKKKVNENSNKRRNVSLCG